MINSKFDIIQDRQLILENLKILYYSNSNLKEFKNDPKFTLFY